jgi:hypothetical protein
MRVGIKVIDRRNIFRHVAIIRFEISHHHLPPAVMVIILYIRVTLCITNNV